MPITDPTSTTAHPCTHCCFFFLTTTCSGMDFQAFLHLTGKGRSLASCCSRRGAWLGPASSAASGGSRELCECEHSERLKCKEIGSPAAVVRVGVPCTKGLG